MQADLYNGRKTAVGWLVLFYRLILYDLVQNIHGAGVVFDSLSIKSACMHICSEIVNKSGHCAFLYNVVKLYLLCLFCCLLFLCFHTTICDEITAIIIPYHKQIYQVDVCYAALQVPNNHRLVGLT